MRQKHLVYKEKSIYIWYLNNDFHIEEKIENVSFATNGYFKKWNFITFSELHKAFDSCSVTKYREIWDSALSILSAIQEKIKAWVQKDVSMFGDVWQFKIFEK